MTPLDTGVAVGDTVVLECDPPAGLPRPEVQWLKEGQPVSNSSSSRRRRHKRLSSSSGVSTNYTRRHSSRSEAADPGEISPVALGWDQKRSRFEVSSLWFSLFIRGPVQFLGTISKTENYRNSIEESMGK